jgi:hypothetical protein
MAVNVASVRVIGTNKVVALNDAICNSISVCIHPKGGMITIDARINHNDANTLSIDG